MFRLYMVRHAQSGNNAMTTDDSKRFVGRIADPSITQLGVKQTEHLCKWLNENAQSLDEAESAPVIYCSAMRRALQTANLMQQHLIPRPSVEVVLPLHEEGGLFSGRRKSRSPSPYRSDASDSYARKPSPPRPSPRGARLVDHNSLLQPSTHEAHSTTIASSILDMSDDRDGRSCEAQPSETTEVLPPAAAASACNSRELLSRYRLMVPTGDNAGLPDTSSAADDNNITFPVTSSSQTSTRGIGRVEASKLYPSFKLPKELQEHGWWRRSRETVVEVQSRVHRVADWLWEMTERRSADVSRARHLTPRYTILVAHGMFQDLMLRTLSLPLCSQKKCNCINDAKALSALGRTSVDDPEGLFEYQMPLQSLYFLSSNASVSAIDLHVETAPKNQSSGEEIRLGSGGAVGLQLASQSGEGKGLQLASPSGEGKGLQLASQSQKINRCLSAEQTCPSEDLSGSQRQTLAVCKRRCVGIVFWNKNDFLPKELRTGHAVGPFSI